MKLNSGVRRSLNVLLGTSLFIAVADFVWSNDNIDGANGASAGSDALKIETSLCEGSLLAGSAAQADQDLEIQLERHTLMDLLASDPSKNLISQSPGILMTSFQLLESMIVAAGVSEVGDPLSPTGKVSFLNLFSSGKDTEGNSITDGRKTIGHLPRIEKVYNLIRAGARGDRSGNSVPFLVGEAGTGKSELLTVLSKAALHYTRNSPEHFVYTYEWKKLEDIPDLRPFLPSSVDADGNLFFDDISAPMNDSPFALLPGALQDQVLEKYNPEIQNRYGFSLDPIRRPNPQCNFFRDRVLEYYSREHNGGKPLSNEQIIAALQKHVAIKRIVLGKPETAPLISAQGRDVDYQGLFMRANPMVANIYGSGHPMAYFYNGKFLSGNRFAVHLDEFIRNDDALKDTFLTVFESREVALGGTPTVPFDAMLIGAGNRESISNSGTGSNAQFDRFLSLRFDWAIRPHEIYQIFAYMKAREFRQQKLLSASEAQEPNATLGEREKIDLEELFPRPRWHQPHLGPDRRYNLTFGEGADQVHVGPHALMHMAMVIASTRIQIETPSEKIGGYKVLDSAVFKHLPTRMQVLMGELKLEQGEARELSELSDLLNEGSFGITARDAGRWLTRAIEVARKKDNKNSLTPEIVRATFKEMLQAGEITSSGHDERLEWLRRENVVAHHFLYRRLADDIITAVGFKKGLADAAYWDFLEENFALSRDPDATHYESTRTGDRKKIDHSRYEKVVSIFQERNNGRPFPRDELVRLYHFYAVAGQDPKEREGAMHSGLMAAVSWYYMQQISSLVPMDSEEDPSTVPHMRAIMHNHLGYDDIGMREAIEIAREQHSRTANVR